MKYFLAILLALLPSFAFAAWPAKTEEDEFFNLERASLEETLNIKTSVATKSEMHLRETPGLVTVITRDEIQSSGARDLIDVLKMVPELDIGMDDQGNLGLAVRGNWANEGKILLMWDGQTYNETLYSTLQLDRFPVDQIEQIEIIKGPGSALYGGFAELAVIKIKTLSAKSLKGSEAFAAYGQGEKARAREYAGYSYGGVFNGTEVTAKAFLESAQRSDLRYTDFSGASYNMNGNSVLRPESLNLSAARGDTSVRLILDDYYLRYRDDINGAVISTGVGKVGFPTLFAEAKTSIFLPGLVRLEPRLAYMAAKSWLEKDAYFPYEKSVYRLTASLTAFYRPAAMTDLLAGAEYYRDHVRIDPFTSPDSGGGVQNEAQYDNYALFGQGTFTLPIGNLIAGARYDKNSQYGSSLVPRLALTRLIEDFNFKAIYSQAFHAPSIENIRLNPGIRPEKATSSELEAGYKASDTVFFSGNFFHTMITDPIVFSFKPNGDEDYTNYSHTGTYGFGFTLKLKDGASRADLGYLCYFAHRNAVGVYTVPGDSSYLLGFPRHKVTLTSSLPLGAGVSLNPSAVYTSKRYGYNAAGTVKAYGEKVDADLNLQLKDKLARGLTLNLGVKDIFKSNYSYIQPYDGGHTPLPASSREIFIKAGYDF